MPKPEPVIPPALLNYYKRVGAEVLNFRRAMIRQHSGKYYIEKCIIRIGPDGAVDCSRKEFAPTEEEQAAIRIEWTEADMPRTAPASKNAAGDFARTLTGPTFLFHSRRGGVVMIQQRYEDDEGNRNFVPWSYFTDGEWRAMEPDGLLPIWKPEKQRTDRIMIHEGAKAAQACEAIATDKKSKHPWAGELAMYEHWGMIGGALAPHRTDFSELYSLNPIEIVYVCDNDFAGKSALQEVSRHYGRRLKGIKFDPKWPIGWDMADEIPPRFFIDGRYIGPLPSALMSPATYATDTIHTGERGRPITVIRREFTEEWFHSVVPEVYVHRDWPNRMYSSTEFNNRIRPFSSVDDTARLMKMQDSIKGVALKYDPTAPSGVYSGDDGCLNTHVPCKIKPEKGNPSKFMEFIGHLCPREDDRANLLRWIATLIARPDIKILYGLLLISETQGVGKGTLGEKILAPLVGMDNVSMPTEAEIVDSDFNYWAAHKRLAVVHEIYAGHSAKAYNKLKSLITDDHITINKKFMPAYQIDNWVHVVACSNSLSALKLSVDDRRWFVPQVNEDKLPAEYWKTLNHWLTGQGGLQIIRWWAEEYVKTAGNVITKGEPPPWSITKREVIEENWSPGMKLVSDILSEIKDSHTGEEPIILLDKELVRMIKEVIYQGRQSDFLEKPSTIRKLCKACGWYIGSENVLHRRWGGLDSWRSRIVTNVSSFSKIKPADAVNLGIPLDIVSKALKNNANF